MTKFSESNLFNNLIENIPDAIIITNEKGIIELANNKVFQVFGYLPEELIGKEIAILVPIALRERHREHIKEYFKSPIDKKMGAHQKVHGLRKDGTEFEVDITLGTLNFENELFTISSARDISDKKEREEELKLENISLQMMNKGLEKYSYTITHDLKAPLAKIEGLVELLIGEIKEKKPIDQLDLTYQYLLDSIAAIKFLITKELEEAKKKQEGIEHEEIQFEELFKEVTNLISIPEKFEFKLACDKVSFSGRKVLFIQVLLNLLSNAIKYNDKEHGFVEIACKDVGSEYEFSFSDNGIGISEENQKNIFNLFKKHTQSTQSHGVGLHTVKSIVESRGGKIWVKSTLGEGTIFTFIWPKKPISE